MSKGILELIFNVYLPEYISFWFFSLSSDRTLLFTFTMLLFSYSALILKNLWLTFSMMSATLFFYFIIFMISSSLSFGSIVLLGITSDPFIILSRICKLSFFNFLSDSDLNLFWTSSSSF